MADKDVDPGALLVAVLTVGAVPLVDDGPWSWLDSFVAAVVLVVISCYLWPDPYQRGDGGRTAKQRLVFTLVGGFILAVFMAAIVQHEPSMPPSVPSSTEMTSVEKAAATLLEERAAKQAADQAADDATLKALLFAYPIWAAMLWIVPPLWRQGRGRSERSGRTGPETATRTTAPPALPDVAPGGTSVPVDE